MGYPGNYVNNRNVNNSYSVVPALPYRQKTNPMEGVPYNKAKEPDSFRRGGSLEEKYILPDGGTGSLFLPVAAAMPHWQSKKKQVETWNYTAG